MGLSDQYNDKGNDSDSSDAIGLDGGQKKGLLDALRVPTIFISTYSLVCAAISIGFIQATLEPHLRQFGLSPVMMGKLTVQNEVPFWLSLEILVATQCPNGPPPFALEGFPYGLPLIVSPRIGATPLTPLQILMSAHSLFYQIHALKL